MPEDTVKTPVEKPKKAEVPRTEISQAEDKAARNYYILMGCIIGATVLIGGYVIYRLATQYGHQANVNRAQDMEISSLQTKQKNLVELQPNYNAIVTPNASGVSQKKLILDALPTTQDYENLIAILEKMGQESGVKVSSVTQGSGSGSSPSSSSTSSNSSQPTPLTFTVNIEGTYNAILDFLGKTEQSSRVINFSSMDITGGSNGTTTGNITANLTMMTYWQDKADISPTTKPLQ